MAEAAGPVRRFRFGLRALLAALLLPALFFAWVGNQHRQVRLRSALVAELSGVGIVPYLEEPTAVGCFVKKRFPNHEAWVRDRFGEGWLSHPTVFLCWRLADDQAPDAVDRLRCLGTVHEVHYQDGQVTERGLALLSRGLPGVGVVPRSDAARQVYYQGRTRGAQLAIGGVVFEGILAATLLGVAAAIVWTAVSFVRRRRLRLKLA